MSFRFNRFDDGSMPGTIGDASSWHEAQSMSPNFSTKLLNWMTEPSLPVETPESHLHLQRGYAGEFIGLDQDGRPVLAFEEEDAIDASSSDGSTQQDTQGKAGDQRFIAVVHSSDPASISFSNEFHSGLAVGAQSYFYQQRQGGQQQSAGGGRTCRNEGPTSTSCAAGCFAHTSSYASCSNHTSSSLLSKSNYWCLECCSGKYQSSSGQRHCKNCEAGSYQAGSGATSCHKCEAGKHQRSTGQSSCECECCS